MAGVSIATGVTATDALGGGQGRGLQSPGVVGSSGADSSVTGTLTATVLASVIIPANALGPNGRIQIWHDSTVTNNANNKIVGVNLGGTGFGSYTLTASNGLVMCTQIIAKGATNSQWCLPAGNGFGATGAAAITGAVDMTQAQTLQIIGTLANVADTITLRGLTVLVLNP